LINAGKRIEEQSESEDSYDEREIEFVSYGIIVLSDLRMFLHEFRMCLVIIID